MKEQVVMYNSRNFFYYILGMFVIAFGVVMMLRSNVGLSSWDTLHYSMSKLFPITVGNAVIIVAMIFMAIVVIMNKKWKYTVMAIPIFAVGYIIDFLNLIVFVDFHPELLWFRILLYIIGLLFLPLGGSLSIISTFPAGVFDEVMLVISRKTNRLNIKQIRVIMELSAVCVAFIFGQIAGIGFGEINIGTLIFSLSVGSFVHFYLTLFEKFGIYSSK